MSNSTNSNLLNNLNNVHYPNAMIYKNQQKLQALIKHKEKNELELIFHLTEVHAPGLRSKAALCYEKLMIDYDNTEKKLFPINKENINFNCNIIKVDEGINRMFQMVTEMPEEWTIVQLTSDFNFNEYLEVDCEKHYTSAMYVTIFKCGRNQLKPFCIKLESPKGIFGDTVEIRQEMHSIIKNFKNLLQSNTVNGQVFVNRRAKENYVRERMEMNDRIKNVVKQMQNNWLKEWRCLLIGKYTDENLENEIMSLIEATCINKQGDKIINKKVKTILSQVIKGSPYLKLLELKKAFNYCFENEKDIADISTKLINAVEDLRTLIRIDKNTKRHPIILVLDDQLDGLPWEMIDVLDNHPVSRMPSLHFTYALFKEHESSIVKGIKVGINPDHGSYVINPSLDLEKMEERLSKFFKYWLPKWKGIIGTKPNEEDFETMLTKSDIFSYHGHGDGMQYLPGEKIQRLKINSIVLLFGCSSTRLKQLGPSVEMYGPHYTYLIACSPCVLGMLWEVTDEDADVLTANFFARWLPSEAETHWNFIDIDAWKKDKTIRKSSKLDYIEKKCVEREPELLRVMSKVRKSAQHYLTQAAWVARGLPVKSD